MNTIKLRLILSLLLSSVFSITFSQSLGDQLLIYRNTGVTDLLWQSQLDSITTTDKDTLGNVYDEPYAQIFYHKDGELFVPIAEIDSVCFGSRNDIEYRNDVRILSRLQDEQWIIRCEDECIYYTTNTPVDILPAVGQKLYYPEQTELFPYGLSAKVVKMTKGGSEIAVQVEQVGYEEIFSKFFYAGSIDGVAGEVVNAKRRSGEINNSESLKFTLPVGEYGEVSVNGSMNVKGDVVLDIFKNYYHADLNVVTSIGTGISISSKNKTTHNYVKNFAHVPFPTIAGIFMPSIDFGVFTDLNAELSLKYSLNRQNTTRIIWTRNKGKNSFEKKPSKDGNGNEQAKVDIVLNGSVFAGLQSTFDFALVGDLAGARVKLKYGTEFGGELSFGMLSDLSKEYDAKAYGSAELSLTTKSVIEGCLTHREKVVLGKVKETTLVEFTHITGEKKLDLFPKFKQSKATRSKPNGREISVSTKVDNTIAHDLETGFELKDPRTGKVMKFEYLKDEIKALEEIRQYYETGMYLNEKPKIPEEVVDSVDSVRHDTPDDTEPKEDIETGDDNDDEVIDIDEIEEIEMCPIFRYAGYTIPYESVTVAQEPNIQPVICFGGNGAVTFVSGVPVVGTSTVDDVTCHIGPYVPVAVYDKDFHETSPYVCFVGVPVSVDLTGTWECELDDVTKVQLCFNDNGTMSLKENDLPEMVGEYALNSPQNGYVTMTFDNNADTVVFVMDSIDNDEMKVIFRRRYPNEGLYIFRKSE